MGLPGSHPRTSDADEADDIELLKAKERLDDADLEKEIECEADTEALLLEDHRASADRDFDSTGHRREDIERHEDPREKRLVWKLDKVILPLAMLLYLSAYLDRGNLGNARLQGLQAEILHGSDTKYSIALSCFFITYILLSIPGTLLAKAILPSRCIAIGALIWSAAAAGQAFASGPRSLYLCRLFVGVGEAMFGQVRAPLFTRSSQSFAWSNHPRTTRACHSTSPSGTRKRRLPSGSVCSSLAEPSLAPLAACLRMLLQPCPAMQKGLGGVS